MKGIIINNVELRLYSENSDKQYAGEIIYWYPNVYYQKEKNFVVDKLNPDYYIDTKYNTRVHKGCFLHPKSCYVIAFVTKGEEPDIVSVGNRPWTLSEQDQKDFEKIIKHIFEYDPDDDEF
ncbi:hypothetical protein [uncultured Methanobrevibacter sp.]|uniref:hypothetical protein n=1 Tax=uncultured Methanobrevibacter sp. TaxID=253161 RepID=UPI0025E40F78|nr:hypothetical protein [uncultured Methanobrevibacter sp.]